MRQGLHPSHKEGLLLETEGADDDSSRISIFNLDPVEQSKLWLQLGPFEARRVLVGVLRTALLFGGTVVVDRNQLLEGVFFVAMSPDRLAWHLGLEPGAPLPIEVQLLPDAPTSHTPASDAGDGPWELADGQRSWGVCDELVAAIEANHAKVREALRVSSPLIALTGGKYERASDVGPLKQHSSSGAVVTKAWKTADPVVVPQTLWDQRDIKVAEKVREEGQRAWVEAMRDGRVKTANRVSLVANPLGPELAAELPPNSEGLRVVDELVTALVKLQDADGFDQCRTKDGPVVHPGETESCKRFHATTRSLVTRWLDGEYVELLDPPLLPEGLRGPELAVHRSCALGWWTLAYNRAICGRDNLRLLTIFNALPTPSGVLGKEAAAAETAWGLHRPEETFLVRWGERLRRRSREAAMQSSTIPIAGDVVTRLAAFTPAEYSRLQAFDAVGSGELLRNPGRRALFDLVVAIDEVAGDTTSRSRRIRSTMLRAAVVTTVGLSVVLYESGIVALSGPGWAVVAFLAAALLSAPWSDIGALRRMSGSQLQTTLRFKT